MMAIVAAPVAILFPNVSRVAITERKAKAAVNKLKMAPTSNPSITPRPTAKPASAVFKTHCREGAARIAKANKFMAQASGQAASPQQAGENAVVLDRPVTVGTRLAVNDHIMWVADVRPEKLIMRAAVDEEDKVYVKEGQIVRMTLYAFPGQVFFCVAVVMLVIGALTWFGNRK